MLSDFPLTLVAAQGHPQLNRLCNTVFIIVMVSVKEANIFDDFVYYPGLSYEIIHHEVPRTRILSGQEGALMKASLEIFLRIFH
jgi:hypothetical protein